jgi:hypothetical protein
VPALPDLAYIEQPASARDLTRPADLDRYRQYMAQLCLHAAAAASTARILHGILAGT